MRKDLTDYDKSVFIEAIVRYHDNMDENDPDFSVVDSMIEEIEKGMLILDDERLDVLYDNKFGSILEDVLSDKHTMNVGGMKEIPNYDHVIVSEI